MRSPAAVLWLSLQVTACHSSVAAPARASLEEGSAHAFLVLRDNKGAVIAQGDWWQLPSDDRIEVHLRFAFVDGSASHEAFVLSQRRVWTLMSYRSEQRGPSFPRDIEAYVDRGSGRYTVRSRDRDGAAPQIDEGAIELPDDTYAFGMLAILLKNLERGAGMSAHAIAFTPKPRVLQLEIAPEGEDGVTLAGVKWKMRRYVAKAKLGGVLGVAASIMGKQPPDLHYWMAGDPVPTFLRVDCPFYAEGPIWHVEMAAPHWSHDEPAK